MLIIIYFIALTIYGFAELAFQKWFSKKKSGKPDAGLLLIIGPFYAALYLAPLEYYLAKSETRLVTMIIGYSLFVIGALIRFIALANLKHNFSMAVECKDENLLVTNGMYKYVRHPLYAATILIASSGCLIFSSVFCWLFFLLLIYGIILRINKEEIFLNNQFSGYKEYSRKTRKLFPFIY
jgi:protein-S-isoprenylcysteine O-methyltransferase Ste14